MKIIFLILAMSLFVNQSVLADDESSGSSSDGASIAGAAVAGTAAIIIANIVVDGR